MIMPPNDESERKSTIKSVTWEDLTWTDIVQPDDTAKEFLSEQYHFSPLALDDCLSRKQLSKVDVYPGYLFFVFHFPVFDKKTRTNTKKQWSAFIGETFLVTLRPGDLKTLDKLFRECEINDESRQQYLSQGSGFLMYKILDRAIDSYFPVLDKIMSLMEDVEDSVFDEEVESTREISVLRRDIIIQRSIMFPTRTLFGQMENKLKRFSKIDLTDLYGDLMDHINKICDTLDECEEIIEVFKDTDYILATDRLNRVMRILTIFSTILLPFIAISSIYGMNVFSPGGMDKGSLTTFIVLIVAMSMMAIAMLIFFRRRRWI